MKKNKKIAIKPRDYLPGTHERKCLEFFKAWQQNNQESMYSKCVPSWQRLKTKEEHFWWLLQYYGFKTLLSAEIIKVTEQGTAMKIIEVEVKYTVPSMKPKKSYRIFKSFQSQGMCMHKIITVNVINELDFDGEKEVYKLGVQPVSALREKDV